VRLAAVGPATADACSARGLAADAMPAVHQGTALAGALGAIAGRRILLPASDIGRDETSAALREAGALVDVVVAYRTVTARPDPEALRALEAGADAVTLTSPSTLRGFLELGGRHAARLMSTAVVACIGSVTADAVRALGFAVHVQPGRHTAPALAEALAAYFATRAAAPAPEGTG
jgi:uroporphyrinogen-III synthase